MAVQIFSVQVSSHYNLKALTPNTLGKFHTDLLCKLRCNVLFLKAHISVIGLYSVRLSKTLFCCYELVTGSCRMAVYAINIILTLCFFLVLCIGYDIGKRLILCVGIIGVASFLGIVGIVNHPTQIISHNP